MRFAFFLGGSDLEMKSIASLLVDQKAAGHSGVSSIFDHSLSWGAVASDYGSELDLAAQRGEVPVLIELGQDGPLPEPHIIVDHHGERVGLPSALRQVFDLLALPEENWTRDYALVAANDVGHVSGMLEIGATPEEISQVRKRDRAAQGISEEQERAGREALLQGASLLDGTLLCVHLPHGRAATVTDPMALAGDARDLLILSPGTVQFFGSGRRIQALDRALPGGWRGGALPARGYWGIDKSADEAELLKILKRSDVPFRPTFVTGNGSASGLVEQADDLGPLNAR